MDAEFISKKYSISLEEAKEKISERQKTFSLEKCIQKYGEVEGLKRFKKRQEKWQKTLNNKSEEEKFQINLKKFKANGNRFYSNSSFHIFNNIQKLFPNIKMYYGNNEYFLRSLDSLYFYDLTIPSLKIIIEYHGIHVHPKEKFQKNWKHVFTKESSEKVYQKDLLKRKLAEKNEYNYYEFFSDTKSIIIEEQIKNIINEQLKKTRYT